MAGWRSPSARTPKGPACIVDFALAVDEWKRNAGRLTREREIVKIPVVPPEHISVATFENVIGITTLDGKGAVDLDHFVLVMEPATARTLAERLLEECGGCDADKRLDNGR